MDLYPKFELGKSRYDLTTFWGRFLQNLDIVDPRTLFVSEAKLDESVSLLEQFKNGTLPTNVTDKQLWQAKKIKDAIIHPDTGEKIFMPFRMSGYIPFNSPIVAGMMIPNPGMAQLIFWQWLNQSHNACVNYANRNASQPTKISKVLQGYTGAITAAISISVGLSLGLRRAKNLSPNIKNLIQKFVPLPAVATAGAVNVVLMRLHEVDEGISVMDKNGNHVGTSKLAAKKALKEMGVARALLPVPLLVVPPIVLSVLEKASSVFKNIKVFTAVNIIVVGMVYYFALPATLAIYPQISEVRAKDLEPEISENTNYDVVYYNKGL